MQLNTDILLQAENLSVRFPVREGVFKRTTTYVHAVNQVSFLIRANETLGLVGETGCGKSTLGRAIMRLQQPYQGSIKFENTDITKYSARRMKPFRRKMQMVFQDPSESLNERHSIGAILREPFIVHGVGSQAEQSEYVADLLNKVGLSPAMQSRYPFELSGGQRQRIGIARAIALGPKFILCDEPVSALDVSIQSQIINLFLQLQEEMALSYLFIAHDLAAVKAVSDRIAVMYLGRIMEIGPADSICSHPAHPYTRALFEATPNLEPRRKKNRPTLAGEIPSPVQLPTGCVFNTRCAHAQKRCFEEIPALREVSNEQQTACHFDL